MQNQSDCKKYIAMKEPDLYGANNQISRRDIADILQEYSGRIQWKNKKDISVLDVGCGDGGLTADVLLPFLPDNSKLTACDIGPEMLAYARNRYRNKIEFRFLDITGDIPTDMLEYDHVFSFFTLHFVQEQKKALSNFYKLMAPGGSFLLVFLAQFPIHSAYRTLCTRKKWSKYMLDVEKFISPYYDSQKPEEELAQLMEQVGFKSLHVQCKNNVYVYDTIEPLRDLIRSVNAFYQRIPTELRDEFLDEEMDLIRNSKRVRGNSTIIEYKLLVAFGVK